MKELGFEDFVGNKEAIEFVQLLIKRGVGNTDVRIPDMVFLGPSGHGKAQPLESIIITPDGLKKMGNIKIGDVILSPTGKSISVTGTYPQGEVDIVEITFSDDTKVQCCESHLWFTQTSLDRGAKRTGSIKNTKDIMNSLMYCGKRNHSIPMTKPVEFSKKSLPIHPYVLGCLLGDGYLAKQGCITMSSGDKDIIDRIDFLLGDKFKMSKSSKYDYRIINSKKKNTNAIKEKIRDLNLLGKKSNDKFIPTEYLYSSISDRVNLLRGLMDTDGTIKNQTKEVISSQVSFSSVSIDLANGVKFLVESLGGIATISSRFTTFTYKGVKKTGQESYRVSISMPNGINPFLLKRKASMVKIRTKYLPKRYISSVRNVGKKEAQCISVSCDSGLYLTNNFIVTHNTTLARIVANHLGRNYIEINSTVIKDPFQFRGYVTNPKLTRGGAIILLDECHCLKRNIQDNLLSALQTPRKLHTSHRNQTFIDSIPENISFIFATTHAGQIRQALRNRLREVEFGDYSIEERQEMTIKYLVRKHKLSGGQINAKAILTIAKRSRDGRHITENCDDTVELMKQEGETCLTLETVEKTFRIKGIDRSGLTRLDRKLLKYMAGTNTFVGLDTLEAAMNMTKKEIKENLEPWLLRNRFISRHAAGRLITKKGFKALLKQDKEVND